MSQVKFNIDYEGNLIQVSYDGDIILKDFMLDFLKKQSGISWTSLPEWYKFKCGPRLLNSGRFEKRKLKEIIRDGQIIRVYDIKNIQYSGGPAFLSINMRKEKVEKLNTSNNESNYEKIHKGINIYGICRSQKCDSCQKIVISDYNKENIDFLRDLYDITCPLCKATIEPKKVVFYKCKYRIHGKHIEYDKLVDFDNGYKEANSQEYCDYYNCEDLWRIFFDYSEIVFNIQEIYN